MSAQQEAPNPPAAAVELLGEALASFRAYAAVLADEGVERGLLGPREVPRLWERHLLNSVALAPLLREGAHVVDVGSGAGLPGIPLALARPDLRVTLVEPMQRRVAFLEQTVAHLSLEHQVDTLRGRVEDLPAASVEVMVARAVAPLERLVRWCVPALSPGGQLVALKGSAAPAELEAARTELAAWRVTDARVHELAVADGSTTWAVTVTLPRAASSRRDPAAGPRRTARSRQSRRR